MVTAIERIFSNIRTKLDIWTKTPLKNMSCKNMYITLFIYVAIVRDILNKNIDLQKFIYITWKRR